MTPLHVVTPLWEDHHAALDAPVWLKMDALQPVGSFKLRGLGALCQQRAAEGARALVCSSGGNAGYAVAYAGRALGLPVRIVVPRATSEHAREVIRRVGATVLEHGAVWDDAHAHALTLVAADPGMTYVHPFDAPEIWAGHASLIEECARQRGKPGAVVVSVGGGGLLCGVIEGMQRVGWGDVPVLAVETEGAASYAAALEAGALVELTEITSLATTLGARKVCQRALDLAGVQPVTPWQVSDRAAVAACLRFADRHRVLVEPSCGAALAALEEAPLLRGRGPVLVVVCGGAGVTLGALQAWKERVGL